MISCYECGHVARNREQMDAHLAEHDMIRRSMEEVAAGMSAGERYRRRMIDAAFSECEAN